MFHGRTSLSLVLLLLLVNFVSGFGLGLIPRGGYRVRSHSSSWFSAACAAAIILGGPFFCLYQGEKSSDSKMELRQASNRRNMVLEAAKLAYANKTKE